MRIFAGDVSEEFSEFEETGHFGRIWFIVDFVVLGLLWLLASRPDLLACRECGN